MVSKLGGGFYPRTEIELHSLRIAYRDHFKASAPALRILDQFAEEKGLSRYLGVFVSNGLTARDGGVAGDGNAATTSLGVTELARKIMSAARELNCYRVFLSGDDGRQLGKLHGALEADGLGVESWPCGSRARDDVVPRNPPSRKSSRAGGPEAAVDMFACCYCLSRCRGLLSTYCSAAAWAALWVDPCNDNSYPWFHFDQMNYDARRWLKHEPPTKPYRTMVAS